MPRRPKPPKPTSEHLKAVLSDPNRYHRIDAFRDYSLHTPDLVDLPTLRQGLNDPNMGVALYAATSIGKLGHAAVEATDDLLALARRPNPDFELPQYYIDSVIALARINPTEPRVLDLVREFYATGDTWLFPSTSIKALQIMDTPDARKLIREIVAFVLPDANVQQRRFLEARLKEVDECEG
jgi:hypothetical protein